MPDLVQSLSMSSMLTNAGSVCQLLTVAMCDRRVDVDFFQNSFREDAPSWNVSVDYFNNSFHDGPPLEAAAAIMTATLSHRAP